MQRCRFLIIQLKYYETLYRYHFSHNLVEVLRNFIVVVIMPRYCKYLMQLFAKTFYKRIILQQCLLFNFRRLHQQKSFASKFLHLSFLLLFSSPDVFFLFTSDTYKKQKQRFDESSFIGRIDQIPCACLFRNKRVYGKNNEMK